MDVLQDTPIVREEAAGRPIPRSDGAIRSAHSGAPTAVGHNGPVDEDVLRSRLKLQHLQVALAVAEEGTAVAAAQRLYLSQPSVTRSIRELEEILGAPLFERTPSGMRPVDYTESFLDHARAALSHLRVGAEQVRQVADGEAGTVSVGVHLAGATTLLPRAIAALKHERPRVEVVVRENLPEHLAQMLVHGEIDLMITREGFAATHARVAGEDLHFELLYEETIAIVCGAGGRWVGAGPVGLADLADEQWILPTSGTYLRTELETAFARAGVPLPRRTVECAASSTAALLVTEGGFVGAMPRSTVAPLPDAAVLDVTDCHIGSRTGVLWVEDHPRKPTVQLLLAHLRRVAEAGRA